MSLIPGVEADRLGAAPTPPQLLLAPHVLRDPSGRDWLPDLLAAAPGAGVVLGDELTRRPGAISMTFGVRGLDGLPACFRYPLAPPRELLDWLLDHPWELTEPSPQASAADPPQTARLRRLLIHDDPPGARLRARERARAVMGESSPYGRAWWRLEEAWTPDCVITTDRLGLLIQGATPDPLGASTPWYPARTRLVRDLEAICGLADGRAFAVLLIADGIPGEVALERLIDAGAPHLRRDARERLAGGYLGSIGLDAARRALTAIG
jgi:hypothetical protein